jgi:hypothetical protein
MFQERGESLLDLAAGIEKLIRIDARSGSGRRARFASRGRTGFRSPSNGRCPRL